MIAFSFRLAARILAVLAFLNAPMLAHADTLPGFDSEVYKVVNGVELKVFFKYPPDRKSQESYPAIVFFYGGGWARRNIDHFRPHAEHFSRRGMVAVLADYRVRELHQSTLFDAVADAKSAMRFLYKTHNRYSIDPARLVASGGSAGGHLAACTAIIKGFNDPQDDLSIPTRPAALILFNPVIDNGPSGIGYPRIGQRYLEFSPIHNITPGVPPTIFFLGTEDDGIPVWTAKSFQMRMEENGNRCDLLLYEGQKHGFFRYREDSTNDNRYYWETVRAADAFLVSLGYIKPADTATKPPAGLPRER